MNEWIDAININKIDGNEPSEFLKELIELNIEGKITEEEILVKLKEYYGEVDE